MLIHFLTIDRTKIIQFTMDVAEDVLEFLDLKLIFDKEYKRISVDIFPKLQKVLIRTSQHLLSIDQH